MAKRARRSLKLNVVYNFISQILTLIVPLVTTPYLARVLLETGTGRFSYSNSVVSYFILFANLGFDMYGQRKIASCGEDAEQKSRAFWEIFILKSLFTAVASAVLYPVLFTVGFGEGYTLLIALLSVQVLAVPFDIQFFFRGEENFGSIAIRSIIMRLIGLVCIFVFVKTKDDVWIYCLCFALSVFISNIIMWPAALRKLRFVKLSLKSVLGHLKPAILIFLPTLAVTVYSVFDKTMIGLLAQDPDYQNGCYEQAYKLNSVSLLPVTIISSVLVSRNTGDYAAGDVQSLKNHIKFAINYVWLTGLPLLAGYAVLAGNLSRWFLGEGYAGVPLLLRIMSFRFIFSGMGEVFGNQLFIAIGKEKYSTIATFAAAGVNVILNLILIPGYGAAGAAIATAVCEAVVSGILFVFALRYKYVSLKTVLGCCWRYILAAAVMIAPMWAVQNLIGYGLWQFLLLTALGAVVYAAVLFILRDKFFISGIKNVINAVLAKLKGLRRKEEAPAEGEDDGGRA